MSPAKKRKLNGADAPHTAAPHSTAAVSNRNGGNGISDNVYVRRSTRKLQSAAQILRDITNASPTKAPDTSHIVHKPHITAELRTSLTKQKPDKHCPYQLHVYTDPQKGRCVKSTDLVTIPAHSYVCEYGGELISKKRGMQREDEYADSGKGCYMFYFARGSRYLCIDATDDQPVYGCARYINHSCLQPNLYAKCVLDNNKHVHLCFFALRDIQCNEELLIDYGDRTEDAIDAYPWLLT